MSTQPTPPAVWWSANAPDWIITADGGTELVYVGTSALGELPADARRLVIEDQIETAWEAATGELEERRRQVDRLGDTIVKLGADLARVTQERDQARAQITAALDVTDAAEWGALRWADPLPVPEPDVATAVLVPGDLLDQLRAQRTATEARLARVTEERDQALVDAAEALFHRQDDLVDLRTAAQDLHDLGERCPTGDPVRYAYELAAARVERVIARIEHRAGETPDAD